MFDIAPSELLLVAFVALVVIGPKDLPKAMRVVGYWVGKARGVARQFRSGFDSMVREAELEEMEKRWASENERIMREHPADPDATSTRATLGDAAYGDVEPGYAEPGHAESGDAVPSDVEPGSAGPHDGTGEPVSVERPEVAATPEGARVDLSKSRGAAS